jgi:hypothetical protein
MQNGYISPYTPYIFILGMMYIIDILHVSMQTQLNYHVPTAIRTYAHKFYSFKPFRGGERKREQAQEECARLRERKRR